MAWARIEVHLTIVMRSLVLVIDGHGDRRPERKALLSARPVVVVYIETNNEKM
jgi:hypothetical protein